MLILTPAAITSTSLMSMPAVAPKRSSARLCAHARQVVLTTKVRWPVGSGPNDAGLSRYHIFNAVEGSLRRLGTDVIDVLYMHGWDPWTPLTNAGGFRRPRAAGKARYVGVSNLKAWQVMKALRRPTIMAGRVSSPPSTNTASSFVTSRRSSSTYVCPRASGWFLGARSEEDS